MSLSGRLSLFVALIVIGVVASVTYLETRSFERDIDRELIDASRLGAQSAADNLAARDQPLDALDIRDMLHDLVEADPVLDVISVIASDEAGHLNVFTSTSTEERAEVLDVAGRAIATKGPIGDRTDTVVITAVPVPRREKYAVVATVGLENLLEARKRGVGIALGFALPTIVLVTLLAYLAVRLLVGKPLAAIVRAMEQTAAGDVGVRTAMVRHDELGTIATRLNEMLDQLERFNRSLHERIARAERVAVLGQVAANIAHQAGTPLNLVSGYVQMIRDDPKTDQRTRARLQTVDAQIQQVTRVLRSMLDYARQPPGFETVALSDIIDRVREIAQPRLSRANIRAQTSIASDLPPIRADVTQLEMALLNLVNNALDAMPGGGGLTISAASRPDGIRLEVADTGPGIPAEILERLFEPWATTKPTGQGTGLGLAIVRDVIRSHGGSISAHNRAAGAVFVIDLPAASAVASAV